MAKTLNVYLHQNLTGHLFLNNGQMVFNYAKSWLENPQATPLSQSLPLQKEPFKQRTCRGFFAGVLPEESKHDMVARNLGISRTNDFAMLEQIGGECAGAVTFLPAGEHFDSQDYHYRTLSEQDLLRTLELLPRRPLLAGEDGVRLSLAGAQDKVAVHVTEGRISIPLGNAPSTHILKPANERFDGLVFNEAFCLQLASQIGLPTAKATIGKIDTTEYLLVERYDRHIDTDGTILRLHQEDFCQALGIASEHKYQSEGGPSLKDCFALLRNASSQPVIDLTHLLDAVIFNWLIGNHDAHGKNFSLLYQANTIRFAPLYDLISTVYYPELTKKMAMKIGKEAESLKISLLHFERLAQDAGLAVPMVKRRVPELIERVLPTLSKVEINHPVTTQLAALIEERCQLFLNRCK
jgi:serine/threonine-protein kinase HipA